jgi:hypothetical protein
VLSGMSPDQAANSRPLPMALPFFEFLLVIRERRHTRPDLHNVGNAVVNAHDFPSPYASKLQLVVE